MARQLRVEYPGAIYHVTCRMIGEVAPAGNDTVAAWAPEKCLFRDDADRERFMEQLGERVAQYHVRLYQYVLMMNHFHLVVETPGGNCSQFMQSLTTAYTIYHNLRHRRHGHLLDGRFKAKLVDGDEYLLTLSRYVHLNPVRAGKWRGKALSERMAYLRKYAWSSYPGYIGMCKAQKFVDYGPVLAEMGGRERSRPLRYRRYVETGLSETDEDLEELLRISPRIIGGESFRAWVEGLYLKRVETCARPEDVSFRQVVYTLTADQVLAVASKVFGVDTDMFKRRGRNTPLRAVAARCLIRYAGLTQRDVAELLKVGSGAAVCKQLAGLRGKLAEDRQLYRQVQQVEDILESARKTNPCKC